MKNDGSQGGRGRVVGRAEGVEQMTFDVKGKVEDRKEKRMLTKPENFERVGDRNGLGEKVVDVGGRVQLDQTVFLVQKKEISVRFSSKSRGSSGFAHSRGLEAGAHRGV